MRLGLAGQSYSARSLALAAQTCVNLYPEPIEDPNERAKGVGALFGCPGRHLFKDLTTIDAAATPIRGLWSGGGRLFAAAGPRYMELNSSGALVGSVRTIANDNTPVQFFPNGNQLFIVSAGLAYTDNGAGPVQPTYAGLSGTVNSNGLGLITWASGDQFNVGMVGQSVTINAIVYTVATFISSTQITTVTFPPLALGYAYSTASTAITALTGAFLDGYFIINRPNTRIVAISAINDGTSWSGLDFALKESYPDYVRCVLANNEQLYVFGTETFEVWQNTGAASFPFERINGASGQYGTIGAWSPIVVDGHVYFLGTDRAGQIVAYVLDGFTPRRISTHAQESAWNDGQAPANAYSYTYTEEGHMFWVFHIGTQCWAYDVGNDTWHSRQAWSGSAFTVYPTYCHTFVAEFGVGKHITGGLLDGKLYESSVNFYDDAGADIKVQRALPHLYNEGKRMYFGRMSLEREGGTVALDYSDDRGGSWSTAQNSTAGIDARVAFWPSLGSSKDRVFRLSLTGQAKVALVACDLDVEQGAV